MAKYEKIGSDTYGVYLGKKESVWASIICWIAVIFIVLGSFSPYIDAATLGDKLPTSRLVLVDGGSNLFRYEKGDGSVAAVTLSANKSVEGDRFVVLVATTPEHEIQAVIHAKRLARWFEENIDSVDHVPVVVYSNDKGVGYTFHISGLPYWHDDYAPNAVMNPQQSAAALKDATITYKARKIMRERGEYSSLLN